MRKIPSLLLLTGLPFALAAVGCKRPPAKVEQAALVRASVQRLPLRFEANSGQFDARVRYLARQGGMSLFLTDEGATLSLRGQKGAGAVVKLRVHDALPVPQLSARQPLVTRSNYFIGDDRSAWRTHVPNFAEVVYRGVRPDVDLVYHGSSEGRLEYDFVIAPGGSSQVSLDVEGADELRVAGDGALEIRLGDTVLRQPPPRIYQIVDGKRRESVGAYRLVGRARVGFAVAEYDRALPLVIDPVIVYSTFLGGSGTDGINSSSVFSTRVAVDSSGAAYVSGSTQSTNFPTVAGSYRTTLAGTEDAFVTKLAPDGATAVYSTYIGPTSGGAWLEAFTIDSSGAAYVAGYTPSTTYPTTNGAYLTTKPAISVPGFLTKLAPAGDALSYSTYVPGEVRAVAVDSTGAAYIAGATNAATFTASSGAFQTSFGGVVDAWAAKVSAAGDAVDYLTYLGGNDQEYANAIAVDGSGNAYIAGLTLSANFPVPPSPSPAVQRTLGGSSDAFLTKLAADGKSAVYSTYLGGTLSDSAWGVVVDASGAAYVAGNTYSTNFPGSGGVQPALNGASDAFVTKVAPAADSLVFSSYLGGSGTETANAIALDGSGAIYLGGATGSDDFPVADAFQATNAGGSIGFVTKLNATATALVWSSYLGGTGSKVNAVAVDTMGGTYAAGDTGAVGIPISHAYQPTYGGGNADAYLTKIGAAAAGGDDGGSGPAEDGGVAEDGGSNPADDAGAQAANDLGGSAKDGGGQPMDLAGSPKNGASKGGCGCTVGGAADNPTAAVAFAMLLCALILRRRFWASSAR